MKHLSLLIKPASGACDLRCEYCFYRDEANHRAQPNMGIMTGAVVQVLLKSAFSLVPADGMVSFSFQGGEPTLAGLSFFREFVSKARELCPEGVRLDFSIQTNGVGLDDEWIRFFGQEDFLVGISIDGLENLHDRYRVDARGNVTWARVTQTFLKLRRADVRANVLCVVTGPCARHPGKVYRNLKKLGAEHMQFVACKEPIGTARGIQPYSLSPVGYGLFLCRLFDLWYRDWKKGQYRSIRLFDDYVRILMGAGCGACSTQGRCGGYYVVEANGAVYPCDFYSTDPWCLGRLGETDFHTLPQSDIYRKFVAKGADKPPACAVCKWKRLCGGGCQKDWNDTNGKYNRFCVAFRLFFSYAYRRLYKIAQTEHRGFTA